MRKVEGEKGGKACVLQAGFEVQGSMLGVSKRHGDGGYGGLPLLSSSNSFTDSLT